MFYTINMKKHRIKIILLILIAVLIFGLVIAVNMYFPLEHLDIIKDKAEKYELDPSFVCAVIRTESRFNPKAVSKKGASGLMQIIESTAYWGAEEIGLSNFNYSDIFEPEINIEIGCWYINKLFKQYGEEDVVLAAYNAGSGNVSKWLVDKKYSSDFRTLHTIPFYETRNYIKKVHRNQKFYKLLLKLKGV